MADNLTVRTGDSAAPASGSTDTTRVKSKLDEQVAKLGAVIKQRTGRDANEDMLRMMVLRKTAATERADAADKSRKDYQANTGKEVLQKRVGADERAVLTGRVVETAKKDGLSNEQRKLVTSDPNAPATLPPAAAPQITAKQAETLLEHMFAYVATDNGALKLDEYAKTLTQRPASLPGESAKNGDKATRAGSGTTTTDTGTSTPADRPVTGQPVVAKPGEQPTRPATTGEQPTRPTTGQPTTGEQPTRPTTGEQPTRPTTGQPSAERPTTGRPTTGQPSTQQPTTGRPTTGEQPTRPTTGQPSTEQPTTGRPTTEQPTTGKPAGDHPTFRPQSGQTSDTPTRPQQPTDRPTAQPGASATDLGVATQLGQTTTTPKTLDRSGSTPLGQTTVLRPGTGTTLPGSPVAGRSARPSAMAAEGSGSAATRLSLRGGRSSATTRDVTILNGGGGIDTTTSWDGMHFNWEAFYVKFMFKFQEDENEARHLMKELRHAMHKLAQEGIKAKIAIEKMNQAFERAEKAFEVGAALKGLMSAPSQGQSNELFGTDTAALAESRPMGSGNIDKQMEEIAQQAGVKPGPGSSIYLTKTQRGRLTPASQKRYESLLQNRLRAAGTMSEQVIIESALQAAQRELGEPTADAKTRDEIRSRIAELQADRNMRSGGVTQTFNAMNATGPGRGVAVESSGRLHEGLLNAAQRWLGGDNTYGMDGSTLGRIAGQDRVYNDNMLVNSPNPAARLEKDSRYEGEYQAVQGLVQSSASVDAAFEQARSALDNDLKAQGGLEALAAKLEFKGDQGLAQFNALLRDSFNQQISRTYGNANIAIPNGSLAAPSAGDTSANPMGTEGARVIGGHLAGQAINAVRKDHVKDTEKERKVEDMLNAGAGGISNVSETLRRDLEKINAELISSAQRGASEMDSRIRSSYMQAQGLFNQMTQLLAMSRSR